MKLTRIKILRREIFSEWLLIWKKKFLGKRSFLEKEKTKSKKPRCMNISVQQRGFFIFIFPINASPLGARRIWNPALKKVLTYLGSADLKSAAKEYAFPLVGDYKSPGFIGRTFLDGGLQIRRDA